MPGQGSYGPGGKWIHDRARHILSKSEDMSASSQADKSKAYAIATQQAHKVGKTPKHGAGPRGMYGTPQGKREALQKLDKPKSFYVKTPAPKSKTAGLVARLPLYLGLLKLAAEQDPNTGLVVSAPQASITTKSPKYTKVNVVSPPTPRNLDFAAKSVTPPPVRT